MTSHLCVCVCVTWCVLVWLTNVSSVCLGCGSSDPWSYLAITTCWKPICSNKKAVLSQRWPRISYISRSWAVVQIWPFEIIQDGGRRHLEFVRIENSAIRSAVPESLTLEQNMKWIGQTVAEIWPFEIFPRWRRPPSWIFRTGNSAIRSAVPEIPILEPSMKWIGRSVAEIWPFEIFEMRGRSVVNIYLLSLISYRPLLLYSFSFATGT